MELKYKLLLLATSFSINFYLNSFSSSGAFVAMLCCNACTLSLGVSMTATSHI